MGLNPQWVYADGGREQSGRRGKTRDCVTRAIAIATGRPYADVYNDLAAREQAYQRKLGHDVPRTARDGITPEVTRGYLRERGWEWHPTMKIGSGCHVHLRADELPDGRVIARTSRHVCAVIDGTIYDTHDPSRGGTRCVYGYWTPIYWK